VQGNEAHTKRRRHEGWKRMKVEEVEGDAIMITSTIRIMRGRGFGGKMPQGHALALK
jgi:hypothetical protein